MRVTKLKKNSVRSKERNENENVMKKERWEKRDR